MNATITNTVTKVNNTMENNEMNTTTITTDTNTTIATDIINDEIFGAKLDNGLDLEIDTLDTFEIDTIDTATDITKKCRQFAGGEVDAILRSSRMDSIKKEYKAMLKKYEDKLLKDSDNINKYRLTPNNIKNTANGNIYSAANLILLKREISNIQNKINPEAYNYDIDLRFYCNGKITNDIYSISDEGKSLISSSMTEKMLKAKTTKRRIEIIGTTYGFTQYHNNVRGLYGTFDFQYKLVINEYGEVEFSMSSSSGNYEYKVKKFFVDDNIGENSRYFKGMETEYRFHKNIINQINVLINAGLLYSPVKNM